MKRKIQVKQLLRWHLAQAEAAAPPAPRARRLLEAARPWWETQPEQFQALAEQLGRIHTAPDDAVTKPKASSVGYPVPVLMVHRAEKMETSARVIYLNVYDGRLRLRLRLDTVALKSSEGVEVTFVNSQLRPLFSTKAISLKTKEYRLDVELREPLARDWERLKAQDKMPFLLLFRSSETEV